MTRILMRPSLLILGLLGAPPLACSSGEADENSDGSTTGSSTLTASQTSSSSQSATTSSATSAGPTTASATTTNTSSTTSSGTTASSTAATNSATGTTGAGDAASSSGAATTGDGTNSAASSGSGGASSSASDTGAGGTSASSGTTGGTTEFTLTSPSLTDDGTCDVATADSCDLFETPQSYFQDNLSPELNWTAGPGGTLSYALVFHDLVTEGAHWAIWNIPGDTVSLPAELPTDATLSDPAGAEQVNASWASTAGDGYAGPGSCSNVYEFKLYALAAESFTPDNATNPDDVQDALDASPDVLETTTLRGRANPEDGNNCN